YNSVGMCDFVGAPLNALQLQPMIDYINAVTGWNMSLYELMKVGERNNTLARMFNNREGFTPADDVLPQRMHEGIGNGAIKGARIDPTSSSPRVRPTTKWQVGTARQGNPPPPSSPNWGSVNRGAPRLRRGAAERSGGLGGHFVAPHLNSQRAGRRPSIIRVFTRNRAARGPARCYNASAVSRRFRRYPRCSASSPCSIARPMPPIRAAVQRAQGLWKRSIPSAPSSRTARPSAS